MISIGLDERHGTARCTSPVDECTAILSLALVASAGESYFDTGQIAWINMINEL